MYEFYVKKKLVVALKTAEKGRVISYEELEEKKLFIPWQKRKKTRYEDI